MHRTCKDKPLNHMKRLIILTTILTLCQAAFAQDTISKAKFIIKARVWTNEARYSQATYVVDVTDSAIVVAEDRARFRQDFMNANTIPYQQLNVVSANRKGSFGRGALTGALIGGVSGAALGAAAASSTCSDCANPGGMAWLGGLAGGLTGGFLGALVGGIIGGGSERRFVIGGDKKKFDKMRLSVLEMAYGRKQKR